MKKKSSAKFMIKALKKRGIEGIYPKIIIIIIIIITNIYIYGKPIANITVNEERLK
jgi:hypothetical protein